MANLKDYLYNSIDPEIANEMRGYIDEAYGRFIATLDLIPSGEGRLLEIGAHPYFLTLLIKKFRRYEISTTNYFGDMCDPNRKDHINNKKYNESHEFVFKNVNIETELLPYPDAHFDVVLFCEVMEHLIENPIFALYNLHRVLKPDGTLILSTPNIFRYDNLKKFVFDRKNSICDQYSGYGIYGRHNREYSLFELEDILSNTGYEIISLKTIFSNNNSRLSNLLERANLGSYILIKSKRMQRFNWYYPDYLFRSGIKTIAIDNFVEMGTNCIPCINGFHRLEDWSNNRIRWTEKTATMVLKPIGNEKRLRMKFFSELEDYKFKVETRQDNKTLFSNEMRAHAGWQDIAFAVSPTSTNDMMIKISIDTTWCPKKLGINEDTRELGIAISQIKLIP